MCKLRMRNEAQDEVRLLYNEVHAFVGGKIPLDRVIRRAVLAKVESVTLKWQLKIFKIKPVAGLLMLEADRLRHLGGLEMAREKFEEKKMSSK